MTQHTPGPWIFDHDLAVYGANFKTKVAVAEKGRKGAQEANARLIAAAPELLDALLCLYEHASETILSGWRDHETFETARAAIAKATSQGSPDTIEPSNAEGMVP